MNNNVNSKPNSISTHDDQKGVIEFVLILAIAFVTLALIGFNLYKKGRILTPPPSGTTQPTLTITLDETADWETFTNKEYGFSIKYPKTWTKEEGTHVFKEEDLFSVVIVGKTQKQDTEFYDGARVTIGIPIKTDKEITNWVNEYYPSKNIDDEPNIFSEEIINSLRFHKVYTSGLGCFTYYNIKHNGHIYRIMVFAEGPNKDQHQKTLDQILSTFQFIDGSDKSSEEKLRIVAQNEVNKYPELISKGYGSYVVADINIKGEWAILNYASTSLTPIPTGAHMADINVISGVGKLSKNEWTVYIHNTEKFNSIKNELPGWLQHLK